MEIIFEDKDILVIHKPAGVVVAPGTGKETDSVISEVLKSYPQMKDYDWPMEHVVVQPLQKVVEPQRRIGLVHRLDKDTSGVLVIAKNPTAQANLMHQWESRKVDKEYTTLVFGKVEPKKGRIELPIGRAPIARQKMAAISGGREAITEFEVEKYVEMKSRHTEISSRQSVFLSLLKVRILTGRTHQIRVHLSKIGYPILGDRTYGTKTSIKLSKELNLDRQFLHAGKLSFTHPSNGKKMTFESSLPQDLKNTLDKLQNM